MRFIAAYKIKKKKNFSILKIIIFFTKSIPIEMMAPSAMNKYIYYVILN